jgi:hypothetical protein
MHENQNVRVLLKVLGELQQHPLAEGQTLAGALKAECAHLRIRYQPDEFNEALRIVASSAVKKGAEKPTRSLDELDDLDPNDKERDEVCKHLTPEDQAKLMARYGYTWPVKRC